MRILNRMTVALATAATLGIGSIAGAQVSYTGFTNGCFGVACTPTVANVFQPGVTFGGLTFENSNFSGITFNGQSSVGQNANAMGTLDLDNFGAFYLSNTPAVYTGQTFKLVISFLTPGTGTGGVQSATLTGTIIGNDQGFFTLAWQNPTVTIPLTAGGPAVVTLNNIAINPPGANSTCPGGSPAGFNCLAISGTLTLTPEPASMALVATGLFGLGFGAIRRRRKNS